MKFKDKNIVITGGSKGIGLAAAELLVEQGANVYILDIYPMVPHNKSPFFLNATFLISRLFKALLIGGVLTLP